VGTLLNTASLNVEGEDQQRLKLEEKICVAMEGKEKRKKKEENKQKQATPENVHGKLKNPSGQVSFRSHVARIEMLLTFHPLGVRTPITVAHERLSCIFSPPSMVSHSVAASADTLIVLA